LGILKRAYASSFQPMQHVFNISENPRAHFLPPFKNA